MLAPSNLTEFVVLPSASAAPVQVVAAVAPAAAVRFSGKDTLRLDWVSANPFVFTSVRVNVDTALRATAAGENDALTEGATGFTASGVGQALARVPAELGAELLAELDVNSTVSVSVLPAESVIVNVSVPGTGLMVTWALLAPLSMMLAGEALQRNVAMSRGLGVAPLVLQAATLPLALMTAPAAMLFGSTMTPIGF
jgi:hypothetical protein